MVRVLTKQEINENLAPITSPFGPFTFETKKQNKKQSQVYVLRCGIYYKIGHTKGNIYARVRELQVGNPSKIEIVFTLATPKYKEWEERLHEFYKEQRISGEWFALTEEHLSEVIGAALMVWAKKAWNCTCS